MNDVLDDAEVLSRQIRYMSASAQGRATVLTMTLAS